MSHPAVHPPPPAPPRQPIFNLPPMVTGLLLANLAVHGVRLLLPAELDLDLLLLFGFIPARYSLAGLFGWPALVAPVSHQFLHGGIAHLAVNMAMLMAFGSGIERRLGPARMLAFALLCGVAGAAAHWLVQPLSITPVIGASGGISGLFGGVLRLLPRRPGGRTPSLRGVWPVALLWVAVSVLVGVAGLPGDGGATIAWAAHVGGFVAGILLFPRFERRRSAP